MVSSCFILSSCVLTSWGGGAQGGFGEAALSRALNSHVTRGGRGGNGLRPRVCWKPQPEATWGERTGGSSRSRDHGLWAWEARPGSARRTLQC